MSACVVHTYIPVRCMYCTVEYVQYVCVLLHPFEDLEIGMRAGIEGGLPPVLFGGFEIGRGRV